MKDYQDLVSLFHSSGRPSSKHVNYFPVYQKLFSSFRDKPITFVEIGVADGGSLHMWREYFGNQARIIGIDFNPAANNMITDGFEIYIGDQGDPKFWENFFSEIGSVDILLDDGGHTYSQQQMTLIAGLDHIIDGGLLVIEDTHTSFMRDFGFPSESTFINFARQCVDSLHSRFPGLNLTLNAISKTVWSIEFFESIVAFKVDRTLCGMNNAIRNSAPYPGANPNSDFRFESYPWIYRQTRRIQLGLIRRLDFYLIGFLLKPIFWILDEVVSIQNRYLNRKLINQRKEFFKSQY